MTSIEMHNKMSVLDADQQIGEILRTRLSSTAKKNQSSLTASNCIKMPTVINSARCRGNQDMFHLLR